MNLHTESRRAISGIAKERVQVVSLHSNIWYAAAIGSRIGDRRYSASITEDQTAKPMKSNEVENRPSFGVTERVDY